MTALTEITATQASAALGIAPNTFKKLAAARLLPEVGRRGNRLVVPRADVAALAAREPVMPGSGQLPVLRVGVAIPAPAHEGRAWTGYRADLSAEEKLEALRGWWRCDPDRIVRTGLLAVTVGPYVVAVLTGLADPELNEAGRVRFTARLAGHVRDLVTPVQEIAAGVPRVDAVRRLLGRRLESESGGPIAYVRS